MPVMPQPEAPSSVVALRSVPSRLALEKSEPERSTEAGKTLAERSLPEKSVPWWSLPGANQIPAIMTQPAPTGVTGLDALEAGPWPTPLVVETVKV